METAGLPASTHHTPTAQPSSAIGPPSTHQWLVRLYARAPLQLSMHPAPSEYSAPPQAAGIEPAAEVTCVGLLNLHLSTWKLYQCQLYSWWSRYPRPNDGRGPASSPSEAKRLLCNARAAIPLTSVPLTYPGVQPSTGAQTGALPLGGMVGLPSWSPDISGNATLTRWDPPHRGTRISPGFLSPTLVRPA